MTKKALRTDPAGTAEAYLFVQVAAGADPVRVLGALAAEQVVSWDAVRGEEYSIVLHLHGADGAALEREVTQMLAAHQGVAAWHLMPVGQPALAPAARAAVEAFDREHPPAGRAVQGSAPVASLLLLDVREGGAGDLFAALYPLDAVVVLEAAARGDQILARIEGPQFSILETLVRDRIRALPGVLRVQELKVVPRSELE